MAYKQVNGLYQVPLVDFGKQLQSRGWNIGEHSQFGGNSGGHAPNSYHNYDEALDITWKDMATVTMTQAVKLNGTIGQTN